MKILDFLLCFFVLLTSTHALTAENLKEITPLGFVEFDGKPLFSLHDQVGSFSVKDRAKLISDRLDKLAKDSLFSPESISVNQSEFSADVVTADTVLLTITMGDAKAEDKVPYRMATDVANKIKDSLNSAKKQRSPQQLLIHAGYAVLFTLILVLLLWGLSWLSTRLCSRIETNREVNIKSVQIKGLELISADRITEVLIWLIKSTRYVFTLIILYIYIPLVLSLFPWTAALAPKLFGYISEPLINIGTRLLKFIPNLFFIGIIGVITRFTLRFLRFFFAEIGQNRIHFSGFFPEWAEPTYKLVRILVLAFAIVVIFPYLPGSGSPAFQGVSVFLGLIFSFGSSSAISNMVSGIVLTYMRPFKIGDRVRIADTIGDVLQKTLLVTRIQTIKNVEVTIPNSIVLGNHIYNYSSSASSIGLILNTTVTIGYDVSWTQIHELLKGAAQNTQGILDQPKPFVLQTALNDFYVSYELNAYTDQPNRMAALYSELHQNIQNEFNKANVEIMSPHYRAMRDGSATTVVTKSP